MKQSDLYAHFMAKKLGMTITSDPNSEVKPNQ
jgi:hypothetical protein